jgi:adenine phosphoribosyltransferase
MPIKSKIRTIPNYPKKGIMFRDITTIRSGSGW